MDSYLKEIISRQSGLLFRMAYGMLHNREDAEDVVSEAILKLFNRKKEVSSGDKVEALLFRMVRNQCIDLLRAKKRHQRFLENYQFVQKRDTTQPDSAPTPSRIKSIISKLPKQQQMIIHLRMVEGYSMQQIANALNIKVNTVEVNLSRARKKIRAAYEQGKK